MSHVERELNRLNNSENNQADDEVEEIELEPVPTEIPSIQYDIKPTNDLFDEPSGDFNDQSKTSNQDKKTYTCKKSVKCQKKFNDKKELQRHESTFKHFSCQPCDKHFTARRQLQEHQKAQDCAHLVCDKCGKNFIQNWTLN